MLMAGGGEELKILLDTSVPLGVGLGDGGLLSRNLKGGGQAV